MPDTLPPRRWTRALFLSAALVWLGIAAATGIAGVQDYGRLAVAPWRELTLTIGSFILQLLPPLAVAVLAFELLRRSRSDLAAEAAVAEARHAAVARSARAASEAAAELDRRIDAATGRIAALRSAASSEGEALHQVAARLEQGATALEAAALRTSEAGRGLETAIPSAGARANDLTALLDATGRETLRQLGEIETMLAGLWAHAEDATRAHDGAVKQSAAMLAELDRTSGKTARAIDDLTGSLQAGIDAALARTDTALTATRAAVDTQTAALLASVDQAQVALDDIGGVAARTIAARLQRVLEIADGLGARLSEQDARSRVFVDTVERSFKVLDAKLGNSAATGNTALDAITARIAAVQGGLHTLAEPLAGTGAAVRDIETGVARLQDAAAAIVDSLGARLPATGTGVAEIEAAVARLAAGMASLSPLVADTDAASARIAGVLAGAQGTTAAINTGLDSAALSASSQLIEALGRVREVANATAGTMRDTLAAVIGEAEEALQEAGTRRAREAFAAPIAAEVAALDAAAAHAGEAAQAAAERIAQRLLGLTRTIATVEARIGEVDERYEAALRDDISQRSDALIAQLKASSIDLTRSLAVEIGEDAWIAYLRGDKGVFARRAVRLLDRGTARQIARQFEQDTPFREQAVRYITGFEALLKHVMPGRDGKTLAVTLLSSDIGKLYVVLAQATEGVR